MPGFLTWLVITPLLILLWAFTAFLVVCTYTAIMERLEGY